MCITISEHGNVAGDLVLVTFNNVEFRGDLSEYVRQIYFRAVRLDPLSSFSEITINNIAIAAETKGILDF